MNPLTFHIQTWGCQMNVSDSDRMAELLTQRGFAAAPAAATADVILLNTCAVRDKPEQKVRSLLGELRALKRDNPDLVVGVCGCMAQREGPALQRKFPIVDLLLGTAQIDRLPDLVEQVRITRQPAVALDVPRSRTEALQIERAGPRVSVVPGQIKAFVPIIDGCDKTCAFCVVPGTRGRERSRPPEQIVAEVERLAAAGCKEVTLIGQNVNAYRMAEEGGRRKAGDHFAHLLARLDSVPGIQRIRFTTNHPLDFRPEMIEAVASLPHVCEWFHLPVQAGDDDLLHHMRRGYTTDHYRALIQSIRSRIPDAAITTDLMIGFPGETEAQFQHTLRLVEEIRWDSAYTFAFSPRPGTVAETMPGAIPDAVKRERLARLIEAQNRITIEKNRAQIGGCLEVLVEGRSTRDSEQLTGHTRGNQTVNFRAGRDLLGEVVQIRATDAGVWGFVGELA